MDKDFDLNLLRIILALFEERNVTSAALRLGATQPTVSRALAKLRVQFGDPLFVKTTAGMKATPRCTTMAEAARRILSTVEEDVLAAKSFNPATTQTTFTFALDEPAELGFFPRIASDFRKLAPHSKVQAISLSSDRILHGFESGEIDLAIGAYPKLEKRSGYFKYRLFTSDFVCVVRADSYDRFVNNGYLDFWHAVVVGSEADFLTEEMLRRANVDPRKFVRVSYYATLPSLITNWPDVTATVVYSLGVYFANTFPNLRIVKAPFKTDRVIPCEYWHSRFHNDPKNKWLRQVIRNIFTEESDVWPDRQIPASKPAIVPKPLHAVASRGRKAQK